MVIGKERVIGVESVMTKDVEPWSVVVCNTAKFILSGHQMIENRVPKIIVKKIKQVRPVLSFSNND